MITPARVRVIPRPLPARVPPGAIYVGRDGWGLPCSPFHNPHRITRWCKQPGCHRAVHGLDESRRLYLEDLRARPKLVAQARRELAGKDLACWCPLDASWCHADDLLRIVTGGEP